MSDMTFPEGFPLSIGEHENPMQIVEDTMFIRACDSGILHVDLYDASMPARDAFRCNGLLPVLVDYANHIIGRTLQLRFDTEYHETIAMDILEAGGESFTDAINAAALRANRPALYNRADSGALLESSMAMRENSGIPLSVSVLMLDMALEASKELSAKHQIDCYGETIDDTLELTPVVNLLQHVNAQPRIAIPPDLPTKIAHSDGIQTPQSILGKHLENVGTQSGKG